ncbi:peptidase C65 Otubain-domain-containing protein [Truncatella angustata]|uniref:ubiquitinyl hydrolase 1 n=1 Tax=Truncatella angustata TaxID=152316 RepID=A0A9P8RPV3_9PEZI|nr:peptidase C65 Otubain-domain-containing protein [Truncatella angustata]KAH6647155.1 peptidase C65 Otubain-domain-containing protein [Truncatella angustata]KAH8200573.1 hypothetical protein TruAng_005291 [Truncatella angustata]
MFQPIRTPLFYHTSYGVANANIPDYTFASTPLGQGRCGSGGGVNTGPDALSPDAAASAYASPNFHGLLDNNPQHHLPRDTYSSPQSLYHGFPKAYRNGRHRGVKMEPPSDLAQQEAAARDYKPELEGPLVGEQKSSHAITEEYAKANPIYVTKTIWRQAFSARWQPQRVFHVALHDATADSCAPLHLTLIYPNQNVDFSFQALPHTYSLYRPIQGDGNCGWRAIGFGYFENLIRCRDINRLQAESARLTALNEYIEKVGGYDPYIFEDMAESTFDLFAEITQAVSQRQDAMPILLNKWNSIDHSNAMIYHLRLLAASWLKGNLAQYEHFITGDANSYCDEWILPVNKEIDQIAVDLLFNIFLEPANVVLEIAYLDTSPGAEVNVHRWPDEAKGMDPTQLGPTINLLYRPDHYDILYRDSVPQPPPPAAPVSLHVNRVASLSHQHEIQNHAPVPLGTYHNLDMTALSMLPGFDSAPFAPLGSPQPMSPMGSAYSPSPQPAWIQQTPYSDPVPSASSPMSSTHSGPSQPSPQPQSQDAPTGGLASLRFSKHMFPMPGGSDSTSYTPEPTFQVQTNIFKQSFYNTAHYNNPHFQPEEYRPDQDDEIPTGRMSGRKRSP